MFDDDSWMFGAEMDAFDEFIKILEQDDYKSFKSMFRGMGKSYRSTKPSGGGRSRKNKGKKGDEMDMMEEMMTMMMVGEMMGMGDAFDLPKK